MKQYLYTVEKSQTDFNIFMAFPGIESFSLSSLGYLWICKLFDEIDYVNLETLATDTKSTRIPPKDSDILGFSFSFDLDFLNIFKLMEKYKIPLKSSDRDENYPLVFGGGPVISANPLPYQDFFDFFIIGDGEDINKKAIDICHDNKELSKEEILKKLSDLEGIFVPKFGKKPVKKLTCSLSQCVYTPVISDESFFKNTFIIEIARGCANRCGFCLASYMNLPARFVDFHDIIKTIDLGLKYTNKIALLGALISAHPRFNDICNYINSKNGIEMSVSSLRADSIDPDVVRTLVNAGQKHTTIAIEAGSDRLRKVINKNLTNEQVLNTAKIARENGLTGLKIYAMIGLPTETQEDLEATVNLAKALKTGNKGFDLTFAFSSFVPKPHTPFQWCGRESTKSLEDKQNYLKKEFHKLGIKARFSSIKWDYWQTLLSRGDERLNDFVLEVYKQGGALGAFKAAARELNINTDEIVYKNHDFNDGMPWDFIDVNPGKNFLIEENKRLFSY